MITPLHRRRLALLTVLFVLTALPSHVGASAQQATPRAKVFHGESGRLNVVVPVWVTDGRGDSVVDLSCEAFRLLEDGVEQEIVDCTPPLTEPSVQREQHRPRAHTADSLATHVLLFFDLYLASPTEVGWAMRDARDRIEHVPSDTTFSIAAFDGSLHWLGRDLAQTSKITHALNRLSDLTAQGLRLTSASMMGGELQPAERRAAESEYVFDAITAVSRVAAALQAALPAVRRASTHREAWLYSPMLPKPPRGVSGLHSLTSRSLEQQTRLEQSWRHAALFASGLGYPLIIVDPRGPHLGTDVEQPSMEIDSVSLNSLRRTVGDRAAGISGGERLNAGGKRQRSPSAAYTLIYSPDHFGDNTVHEIKVNLKKQAASKHLRLDHREAYLDLPPERNDALASMIATSPGQLHNPLGIVGDFGPCERRSDGNRLCPLVVLVPYRNLTLASGNGSSTGHLTLTLMAADAGPEGSELASLEGSPSVPENELDRARTEGYFAFRSKIVMSRSQRKVLAMVSDGLSGLTSTIKVPVDSE